MDYVLDAFGGIPLSTVIIFIAAIAFLVTVGIKLYKLICKNHDFLQEKEATLNSLKTDVEDLKNSQILTVTKTQLEGITTKQNDLEKKLNQIIEVQKNIAEKQEAFEAESRSHNLNKLRDRLLQSYRYYSSEEKNPMHAWSEMEQEAFTKLFKDYEELGGNGFMHSTVEPAMESLEVIEMSNQDKISELMKSRKG